jgi:diguanylate cyclase (GGDEF)-like protein
MDIMFPDGESAGVELIQTLQDKLNQEIPIIFISSRSDFDARLGAVRAGGIAYCLKPVLSSHLVDILDDLWHSHEHDPYRILIVDDDQEMGQYHAMILEDAGMTVTVVTDPTTLLETLPNFQADLVLMDIYMPDCVGTELAKILRQIPGYLGLPIVYLSSETDVKHQLTALKVGADGFLTKPIQPERLISSVELRAERMRSLRHLMIRDSLTGLFNHSNSKLILEREFHTSLRGDRPLCFAMVDLDGFKGINDTHGHTMGDQVLLGLSRLLRQRLRKSDFIGRYGGDELVVIMPDTEGETARKVLDNLRQAFSEVRFFSQGLEFHVTFSCGLACSLDFDHVDALREASDSALYSAKHAGRNQVCLATRSKP